MRQGRHSISRIAAALLACVAATSALGAQALGHVAIAGVSTGSRVRIAARDAQAVVGTLTRNFGDTLAF